MTYRVTVLDNFSAPGDDGAACGGTFPTYEAAVAHCKHIVDDFLETNWKPGISAEQLMEQYALFGEDPIVSNGEGVSFSGWDYADYRCPQILKKRETEWKTEAAWSKFLREIQPQAPSP
jgi:hypothetical protein